jgi:hypothetical protein
MQGLYYLCSLIAFGIIAMWVIRNDRLAPGEHTTGLLRMKDVIPGNDHAGTAEEPSADVRR